MLYLQASVDGKTRYWPLSRREYTIGRSRSCDIQIEHGPVSRRHLVVRVDAGLVVVEDSASKAGLWVNAQRVNRAEIKPDDCFSTGSVLFFLKEGITLPSNPAGFPLAGREKSSAASLDSNTSSSTEPSLLATLEPVTDHGSTAPDPLERILRGILRNGQPPGEQFSTLLGIVVELSNAGGAVVLARHESGWHHVASVGDPFPDGLSPASIAGMAEVTRLASPEHSPLSPRESLQPTIVEIGSIPVFVDPIHQAGIVSGLTLIFPAPTTGHPAGINFVRELLRSNLLLQARVVKPDGRPIPAVASVTPRSLPFITTSESGRALLTEIDRLALSDLSILLLGDSGTGKELLAHRLHDRSPRSRAGGAFIPLNCSAFPSELVEAELFGIHKGVATGVSERVGRFQQASGGTLFLDEIGDLPLALQPKLLRALESGEVLPVGAPTPVAVDVRVVSASHKDLRQAVRSGAFRQDLMFRLAGAEVRVPPLRERPEDILPLAKHFARIAADSLGTRFHGIDLEAAALLLGYGWPGNARELRHMVARAIALSDGPILHAALLPDLVRSESDLPLGDALLGLRDDWRTASEKFARLYFSQLIERTGGNLSEAARKAGLGRSTLYTKLQELGLREVKAVAESGDVSKNGEAGDENGGG